MLNPAVKFSAINVTVHKNGNSVTQMSDAGGPNKKVIIKRR